MNPLYTITRFYRNQSYQYKLTISFLVLVLIPIVFLTGFMLRSNKEQVILQSEKLAELYMDQTYHQLEQRLSYVTNTASILSRSSELKKLLTQDIERFDIKATLELMRNIDDLLQRTTMSTPFYKLRLFVPDGLMFSRQMDNYFGMTSAMAEPWYPQIVASGGQTTVTAPYEHRYLQNNSQRILSVLAPITSELQYSSRIGIACLDLLESDIFEIVHSACFAEYSSVVVLDNCGNIIMGDAEIAKNISEEALHRPLVNDIRTKDGLMVCISPLTSNGWRIASQFPIAKCFPVSDSFMWQVIALVAVMLVVLILLANLLSRSNTRRIRRLIRLANQVSNGNFDSLGLVDSEDEIGELQNQFNFLVGNIRNLMEAQKKALYQHQEMERRLLQAQINPHFLYNTLDLIVWAARSGNMERVCDITLKLARFYRMSLRGGSDMITIRDEIEHMRLYVEIQRVRFDKKIELTTDIEPGLEEAPLLKLFLQPIIENSIRHGIQNVNRDGEIRISISRRDDGLFFSIADNGKGIEQAVIDQLLSCVEAMPDVSRQDGGYGLNNMVHRLHAYYGPRASFDIRSLPGVGTEILLWIPLTVHKER